VTCWGCVALGVGTLAVIVGVCVLGAWLARKR
jgi:hypothetical protein